MWALEDAARRVPRRPRPRTQGHAIDAGLDYAPLYFIAVCAKRALPESLPALSLFGDREESVYAHYNHEVRKNMAAGARIAELEAELERLRGAGAQSGHRSRPSRNRADWRWWRRNRNPMSSTDLNYQINYGTLAVTPRRAARRPERAAVRVRGRHRRVAVEQRMHLPGAAHRRDARDDLPGAAGARPVPRIPHARRARRAHPVDDPGLCERSAKTSRACSRASIARGLLVSDRDFLAAARRRAPPAQAAPLRAVFIRACDRPAQLERLLAIAGRLRAPLPRQSPLRPARRLDDSRGGEPTARPAARIRARDRLQADLLGTAERRRASSRSLAKAVPQAATIAAAPAAARRPARRDVSAAAAAGTSRCCSSAGARLVLLDDDQRLPLRRPDGARDGTRSQSVAPVPYTRVLSQHRERVRRRRGSRRRSVRAASRTLRRRARHPRSATPQYAIERTVAARPGPEPPRSSARRCAHRRHAAWRLRQLAHRIGRVAVPAAAARARRASGRDRDSYLRNVEAGSIWYGHRQARVTRRGDVHAVRARQQRAAAVHESARPRRGRAVRARDASCAIPDALMLELPVAIGHVQETERQRSPLTLARAPPRFNYFVSDFVQRAVARVQCGGSGAAARPACRAPARRRRRERGWSPAPVARIPRLRARRPDRAPAAPVRAARRTRRSTGRPTCARSSRRTAAR